MEILGPLFWFWAVSLLTTTLISRCLTIFYLSYGFSRLDTIDRVKLPPNKTFSIVSRAVLPK